MEVEGFVNKVIAAKPDSGWCCFVLGRKKGGSVTCVGHFLGMRENIYVNILGESITHPRYGNQIKASEISMKDPPTLRGVERFLEFVEGIGPETAEAIVETFQDETMRVLREAPEMLEQVPGIGEKRAANLAMYFREINETQEATLQLMRLGLSANQALKAIRTWGEKKAIEKVEENPFNLLRLPGIGFVLADKIAASQGISREDPRRIHAGIDYVIDEWCQGGHCWIDCDDLIEKAEKTLVCDTYTITQILEKKIREKKTVAAVGNKIYKARLWKAERRVAERMLKLVQGGGIGGNYDPIAAYTSLGVIPTDEQREAAEILREKGLAIITGLPGTGKTLCIRALATAAIESGKRVGLCAPTGRAARRIKELTGYRAQTIHRFLGYSMEIHGFGHHLNNRVSYDVIIMDEASMTDVWLMERFLSAVPDKATVVLVGDVDQLPSVGPGAVLRDTIRSGMIPVVKFSTIHRQAEESPVIVASHLINKSQDGWSTLQDLKELKSEGWGMKLAPEGVEREASYEFVRKKIKKELQALGNAGYDLKQDVQVLAPMKRGKIGVWQLNEFVRGLVNPVDDRDRNRNLGRFAVNDRVIHIRNNYGLGVMNGMIGNVISAGQKEVIVLYDGKDEVIYEPKNIDELMLAFTCTIHKMQGSEIPAIIVVMHSSHHIMLYRQLIYTAVTRASKRCVLVGDLYGVGMSIHNQKIHERCTSLVSWLRGELGDGSAVGWDEMDYIYPGDDLFHEEEGYDE